MHHVVISAVDCCFYLIAAVVTEQRALVVFLLHWLLRCCILHPSRKFQRKSPTFEAANSDSLLFCLRWSVVCNVLLTHLRDRNVFAMLKRQS